MSVSESTVAWTAVAVVSDAMAEVDSFGAVIVELVTVESELPAAVKLCNQESELPAVMKLPPLPSPSYFLLVEIEPPVAEASDEVAAAASLAITLLLARALIAHGPGRVLKVPF